MENMMQSSQENSDNKEIGLEKKMGEEIKENTILSGLGFSSIEDLQANLKADVLQHFEGNRDPDRKDLRLKLNKDEIGRLTFLQNQDEGSLQVREVGLKEEYKGLAIGMELYEKLISYARENHFEKIKSDSSVSRGALRVWIKLAEKYNVTLNPEAKLGSGRIISFEEIAQRYKDKTLPKNWDLSTSINEAVFELTT
jgi:GNAT superfamily N-acetyltransferase